MPLRRPSEKTTVFVCQSNWHLTRFSCSPFVPLVLSLSPPPTLSSICIACSVPISLHLHIFFATSLFLSFNLFFFFSSFSWCPQTLQQQSLRWQWSPLWKRQPSLRPLLRPSHRHLQRGPGASGTPDHPPSSKHSTAQPLIWFTVVYIFTWRGGITRPIAVSKTAHFTFQQQLSSQGCSVDTVPFFLNMSHTPSIGWQQEWKEYYSSYEPDLSWSRPCF